MLLIHWAVPDDQYNLVRTSKFSKLQLVWQLWNSSWPSAVSVGGVEPSMVICRDFGSEISGWHFGSHRKKQNVASRCTKMLLRQGSPRLTGEAHNAPQTSYLDSAITSWWRGKGNGKIMKGWEGRKREAAKGHEMRIDTKKVGSMGSCPPWNGLPPSSLGGFVPVYDRLRLMWPRI